MTESALRESVPQWISGLLMELLDASVDTVELLSSGDRGVRCLAHLDYLRALHRKALELLAQAEPEVLP